MKKVLIPLALVVCTAFVTSCTSSPQNPPRSDYRGDYLSEDSEMQYDNRIDPTSQSENTDDRMITQAVRKALIDDGSLSSNAKNVKVITINKEVTLRGPVNNSGEKDRVVKIVKQVSGVKKVNDEIILK